MSSVISEDIVCKVQRNRTCIRLCKAPTNSGETCDGIREIRKTGIDCKDDICKVSVDCGCGIQNYECVTGAQCVGSSKIKRYKGTHSCWGTICK